MPNASLKHTHTHTHTHTNDYYFIIDTDPKPTGMATGRTIQDQHNFSGDHPRLTPIANCHPGTLI